MGVPVRCAGRWLNLWIAALAVPALVHGGVSRVEAQARGSGAAVTISGRVVDHATGNPLRGALVEAHPAGKRAVTDAAGAFELRLRAGDYMLAVSQVGYGSRNLPVSAGGALEPITIELKSEPLLIEGIRVVGDRFRSRRHMVPLSSRLLDRDRLLRAAGSDLARIVQTAGMMFSTSCTGAVSPAGIGTMLTGTRFVGPPPDPVGNHCIYRRGQVVAPAVFIDDRPAFAGMIELQSYLPADMHHVEVYGMGLMIRAYTVHYVESLARTNRRLPPMIW